MGIFSDSFCRLHRYGCWWWQVFMSESLNNWFNWFTQESWFIQKLNTTIVCCLETQYSLKNKGASRCLRRTFLSKWFHKEPLTSEEPFCFTKGCLWRKMVISDYKKVRKKWFFKEPLTEWFFVEPKMVLLWHCLKNLLKHLYFDPASALFLLAEQKKFKDVVTLLAKTLSIHFYIIYCQ